MHCPGLGNRQHPPHDTANFQGTRCKNCRAAYDLQRNQLAVIAREWGWLEIVIGHGGNAVSLRLLKPGHSREKLLAEWQRRYGNDGGGQDETDKERAERLEREKAAYADKLAALEKKSRKQREALERQPGNKREGARREKMAVAWLKSLGCKSVTRTSPKAPGYDIDGIDSTGKRYQFEVKPKGESLTEAEGKFAEEHQTTWRLIEYNPKTHRFRMFKYSQCVRRQKTRVVWLFNPYPTETPIAESSAIY